MTTCLLFRKIEQLIKDYPKIAEEEAENLDGKITVEEATCELKRMKNEKAQALMDSLSIFKKSWKKRLDNLEVRAINDGFDEGEMSPTQKEGIIICIPKGDKPGEYL